MASALLPPPIVVPPGPACSNPSDRKSQLLSRRSQLLPITDTDARFGCAPRLGLLNGFGPARNLLGDCAVDVALREYITEINRGLRLIFLIVKRRDVLAQSFPAHIIQRGRGIGHARLGMKAPHQLVDIGHLRYPSRAHKGTDGDFLETSLREGIKQPDLVGDRNTGALNLETIAHTFFGQNNFRIAAHFYSSCSIG